MAVADMIVKFSEASGITNSNQQTRAQILRYLNQAGRELWNTADLPGSTFEQYFAVPIDQAQIQITMPWYVDQIRGARWAITGQKITILDFRPRYHSTPWHMPFLSWRVRQRQPLATMMAAEGPLSFFLDIPQDISVDFTVLGQTTNCTNARETVTLLAGETQVATTLQWGKVDPFGIQVISKTEILTCDVNVRDVTGLDVALIPARQAQANNILVQISDFADSLMYQPNNAVEMLYKRPYEELYFDEDIFYSPYAEDALIWRARANWEALQKDSAAMQRAGAHAAKADEIIRQLVANQESEVTMEIEFAPNRYRNVLPFWSRGGGKYNQLFRRGA